MTPEREGPMALVACEECGRDVSTRAEACPGCGCPRKRGAGKRPRGRRRPSAIPRIQCPHCRRPTVPSRRGGGGDGEAHRRCEHCDGVIRTAGDYVVMLVCFLMFCAVAGIDI